MKKTILALFMVAAFAFSSSVNAQKITTHQKTMYYYYPSANVYYDSVNNAYAYDSSGTWVWESTLPSTITVESTTTRYPVYYNGTDVWKQNQAHKMKYKNGQLKKDKPKSAGKNYNTKTKSE